MEKRFFVNHEDISQNTISLTGDEHQHLSRVLRLREGDEVECFCDGGDIIRCVIEKISKNSSRLKILSQTACLSNPKVDVTLFQALPKLDKLEFIAQKITELGVGAIIPFTSTFCIAKDNSNKTERLKKIVVSACKQCGRTQLTKVFPTIKFYEMIEKLDNFDIVIFANETESDKEGIKDSLQQLRKQNKKFKIALIVGSEGGFSLQEIEKLKQKQNVVSISLGTRILRAETAGIVLPSLVLYELGEI